MFNPITFIAGSAVALAIGFAGGWQVQAWRTGAAQTKQVIKVVHDVQQQGAINTDIAAKAQAHQDQVRVVTQTLTKEVPVYVSAEADTRCVVPLGAVRLLNAAAAGSDVPSGGDPSGGSNDAPSGVGLDTVAQSVVSNYGLANASRQQLLDLQEWVRRQGAISTP